MEFFPLNRLCSISVSGLSCWSLMQNASAGPSLSISRATKTDLKCSRNQLREHFFCFTCSSSTVSQDSVLGLAAASQRLLCLPGVHTQPILFSFLNICSSGHHSSLLNSESGTAVGFKRECSRSFFLSNIMNPPHSDLTSFPFVLKQSCTQESP